MAEAARSGRSGRRREKSEEWSGPAGIPFTIPFENNLAKVHLEKLRLFDELRKVTKHEDRRHHGTISGAFQRPATPVKSGGPFGSAKLPGERTKSVPSTGLMLRDPHGFKLEGTSQPDPPTEPLATPKKNAGKASKDFVLPSNNPLTAYTNPHESRGEVVKSQIRHQERLLEAARSRSTPNLQSSDLAQVFRWDHVPVAFGQSEYQAENFPRSIQANRMCGGGKNPKLTRNWGDYERWREASLFVKNAMGKPRL